MAPLELTVDAAIREAPVTAANLHRLAASHRSDHTAVNACQTIRHRDADAGTYCYQTHIAIDGQQAERLPWLAEVLFNAANMARQPWYPQFLGGRAEQASAAPETGIDQHLLAWGRFDLGVGAPRYYRQLVSQASTGDQTRVIVARSVDTGPDLPDDARLAYTLGANGEVLHFDDGLLHWHHICCTPGAGLLPPAPDRWLINTLRRLGLDSTERKTYRQEAEQMRDWLHGLAQR